MHQTIETISNDCAGFSDASKLERRIEIVPYEPWHIENIIKNNPRGIELKFTETPYWGEWTKEWKENGMGFTLMIDSTPIGCAGVVKMGYRRGEAWAVLSSLIPSFKKSAFKALKDGLEHIIKVYELRRVQALVEKDFVDAKRLLTHLGFKEEGLLESFGPNGEDMLIFARIIK